MVEGKRKGKDSGNKLGGFLRKGDREGGIKVDGRNEGKEDRC